MNQMTQSQQMGHTHHVCMGGTLACSGANPCAECLGLVQREVLALAMERTTQAFVQARGAQGFIAVHELNAENFWKVFFSLYSESWRDLHTNMMNDPEVAARAFDLRLVEQAIAFLAQQQEQQQQQQQQRQHQAHVASMARQQPAAHAPIASPAPIPAPAPPPVPPISVVVTNDGDTPVGFVGAVLARSAAAPATPPERSEFYVAGHGGAPTMAQPSGYAVDVDTTTGYAFTMKPADIVSAAAMQMDFTLKPPAAMSMPDIVVAPAVAAPPADEQTSLPLFVERADIRPTITVDDIAGGATPIDTRPINGVSTSP